MSFALAPFAFDGQEGATRELALDRCADWGAGAAMERDQERQGRLGQ